VYRIVPDAAVSEQVAALPAEALASYTEVLEVLGVDAVEEAAPAFSQQEVHLLLVQWWDIDRARHAARIAIMMVLGHG
jgi:hypothetical protein